MKTPLYKNSKIIEGSKDYIKIFLETTLYSIIAYGVILGIIALISTFITYNPITVNWLIVMPYIPLPPALIGTLSVMKKLVLKESINVRKDYIKGYKEGFIQSLLFGFIDILIIYTAIYIIRIEAAQGSNAIVLVLGIGVLYLILMVMFQLILITSFNLTFINLYNMSFFGPITNIKLVLRTVIIIFLVVILNSVLGIYGVVIFNSLYGFLLAHFSKKYLNTIKDIAKEKQE